MLSISSMSWYYLSINILGNCQCCQPYILARCPKTWYWFAICHKFKHLNISFGLDLWHPSLGTSHTNLDGTTKVKDDYIKARMTRKTLYNGHNKDMDTRWHWGITFIPTRKGKVQRVVMCPKVLVVILWNDNNGMKKKPRVYYLVPQIKAKGTHENLKMGLGQSDIYFFMNIFEWN